MNATASTPASTAPAITSRNRRSLDTVTERTYRAMASRSQRCLLPRPQRRLTVFGYGVRLLDMLISEAQRRAVDVRQLFAHFERSRYGREWSTADLVSGLMTDVGDLAAAVQRADGIRPQRAIEPIEEIRHELGDCLWVLLVLGDRFDIDLTGAFGSAMDTIENWLDAEMSSATDVRKTAESPDAG